MLTSWALPRASTGLHLLHLPPTVHLGHLLRLLEATLRIPLALLLGIHPKLQLKARHAVVQDLLTHLHRNQVLLARPTTIFRILRRSCYAGTSDLVTYTCVESSS
jgi:hypothetical protein